MAIDYIPADKLFTVMHFFVTITNEYAIRITVAFEGNYFVNILPVLVDGVGW